VRFLFHHRRCLRQAKLNSIPSFAELAKEGLFPFTDFFASNWPCKSPFAGLIGEYRSFRLSIVVR